MVIEKAEKRWRGSASAYGEMKRNSNGMAAGGESGWPGAISAEISA
jgi:hypothetical protein